MSRVGKAPIEIPQGVKIEVRDRSVTATGPLGTLTRELVPDVDIDVKEGKAVLTRRRETQQARAMHGLCRSLMNNLVAGVSTGFSKVLLINGVGYRAEVQNRILTLNLGYSNPIEYPIADGVEIEVEANTKLTIKGIDKEAVGQVCAEIRSFRLPEPYKGKGVKYEDEIIHRKVGKSGIK